MVTLIEKKKKKAGKKHRVIFSCCSINKMFLQTPRCSGGGGGVQCRLFVTAPMETSEPESAGGLQDLGGFMFQGLD